MIHQDFRPSPLADLELTSKILELINQAIRYKQLKKGVNEVIKVINKSEALCVVMADDANPLALLQPVVKLCEEHAIPYCFIKD